MNSDKPLVSVVTPCFNGEDFIERYLLSVYNQTYKNIELLLIDDGSTDRTAQIVRDFYDKHPDFKGYYYYQQNQGQAEALNFALKRIKGEYLIWPDSDDILATTNIQEKVDFLIHNQEFKMVMCDIEVVEENNTDKVINYLRRDEKQCTNTLFEDFITGKNVYYTPGAFMVETEALFTVIPDKDIYADRWGQNWQILLPMSYFYECGYIHKPLFKYVIRKGSHSRKETTYKELIERTWHHENLLKEVLNGIHTDRDEYYRGKAEYVYARQRYVLARRYKNNKDAKVYKMMLKKLKPISISEWIEIESDTNRYLMKIYSFFQRGK